MNYRRKPEDSFPAIRWTGDMPLMREWFEKVSAGYLSLTVSEFSGVLIARVGVKDFAVGPGEWIAWRDGKKSIITNAQFERDYEPVEFRGVLASLAGKTDVPQPQASAGDASQGNVAREKSVEEANPRYLVRFINQVADLEHLLNSSHSHGYDFVYFDQFNEPAKYTVILRRRD